MREPLENEYFNWLCAKVLLANTTVYVRLLEILHKTMFVWTIHGDKNRAEDGCELRTDFLNMSGLRADVDWLHQPCSVLEMMIALSERALFQTDIPSRDWFWEFLTNLKLNEYGRVNGADRSRINDILSTFMWRTYDRSGHGGMFPMRWPKHDQRKEEIWYQFHAYLDDRGLT